MSVNTVNVSFARSASIITLRPAELGFVIPPCAYMKLPDPSVGCTFTLADDAPVPVVRRTQREPLPRAEPSPKSADLSRIPNLV